MQATVPVDRTLQTLLSPTAMSVNGALPGTGTGSADVCSSGLPTRYPQETTPVAGSEPASESRERFNCLRTCIASVQQHVSRCKSAAKPNKAHHWLQVEMVVRTRAAPVLCD